MKKNGLPQRGEYQEAQDNTNYVPYKQINSLHSMNNTFPIPTELYTLHVLTF